MFDNGIVSFKQPGQPGAISPWAWSSAPVNNSGSSYFISALWADIAPKWGTTTYTTQTDGTYMKYMWNNISEYYSGGSRLSNFALTIRSDGTFSATYANVNLQTSNTSIGYVGDITKNEFTQVYWAPFGTNIQNVSDWSGATTPPVVEPQYPSQCSTNTLYSTLCPGYAEAYAASVAIASVQQLTTNITNPVVETVQPETTTPVIETVSTPTSSNVTSDPTQVQTQTQTPQVSASVSTPVAAAVTQQATTTQTPAATQTQTSSSSSSVSLSTILNIVRSEQSRISAVESSTVQQANDAASQAAAQATSQAQSVASQNASNSQQSSQTSTTSNTTSNQTQSTQSSSVALLQSNADKTSVVNITAQSGVQQFNDTQQVQTDQNNTISSTPTVNIIQPIVDTTTNYNQINENIVVLAPYKVPDIVQSTQISIPETIQPVVSFEIKNTEVQVVREDDTPRVESIPLTGRSPMRDYLDEKQTVSVDDKQQNNKPTEHKKVLPDNDLAQGGVTIAAMSKEPVGYDLYSVSIKDSTFYPPKDIYKKQKVVDNERVLRMMNGKSDKVHEQMVNQQYNGYFTNN